MTEIVQILAAMSYGSNPESDAVARAWIASHDAAFDLFIDGAWRAARGGAQAEIRAPASGEPLASIGLADAGDIARAVNAAAAAGPAWAARPGRERATLLSELARLIGQSAGLLGVLDSLGTGTPIRRARLSDVAPAAREFALQAGWARICGREAPDRVPLGVVAAIQSRQDPLTTLARQAAAALAWGNTLVLKPARSASLSVLYFAELCLRAGLPAGVVNVVTGADAAGQALAAHNGIAQLYFSGDLDLGRKIRALAALRGTRCSAEGSGASRFIVLEDADLDAAVEAFIEAVLAARARRAPIALCIEESVAATLLQKIAARLATVRCGPPLDPSVDVGEHDPGWRTLIEASMAARLTFRSTAEALALSQGRRDRSPASIWSENVNRALDVAQAVNATAVGVNCVPLRAAPDLNGLTRPRRTAFAPSAAKAVATAASAAGSMPGAAGPTAEALRRRRGSATAAEAVDTAWGGAEWGQTSPEQRAQALVAIAARLRHQAADCKRHLRRETGATAAAAAREVAASIERLLAYAALAQHFEGRVQSAEAKMLALSLYEPLGVVGVACPDAPPLLGFISLVAPVLAVGNRCVALPAPAYPGIASVLDDLFDIAGLPPTALRIVSESRPGLATALAAHDRLDGLWYHAAVEHAGEVGMAAAENGIVSWIEDGRARDWWSVASGEGDEFLRAATRLKAIRIPYGD